MNDEEVIYGTIGEVPMGKYDPDVKYGLLNLVSYDGSSYVVHTDPPVGTLPTDEDYWQLSAQGTSKATASTPGTVKPDGVTTEVSSDGALSVKTATQSTAGVVKGSAGITVAADGSIDINTLFEQATELGNIIAGEAIATSLGKIAKTIAVTMGLNENALLKNMLTNMDTNDQNKIPTSAFVHKLYERIGMGNELDIGDNLTAAVNEVNSNLSSKADSSDLSALAGNFDSYNLVVATGAVTAVTDVKFAKAGKLGYITGVVKAVATSSSVLSIPGVLMVGVQTGIAYQNLSLGKSCRYRLTNDSTTGAVSLSLYDMTVDVSYSLCIPFMIS